MNSVSRLGPARSDGDCWGVVVVVLLSVHVMSLSLFHSIMTFNILSKHCFHELQLCTGPGNMLRYDPHIYTEMRSPSVQLKCNDSQLCDSRELIGYCQIQCQCTLTKMEGKQTDPQIVVAGEASESDDDDFQEVTAEQVTQLSNCILFRPSSNPLS